MSNSVFNCFLRRPGWFFAIVGAATDAQERSRRCPSIHQPSPIRFADPADRRLPHKRAAGAFPCFHEPDCCGLVLAGEPGAAGSCADQSGEEARLRLLRAVPERADAVEFRHRHQPGADRGRSWSTCRGLPLHPHLLGRERARHGAPAGIEGRAESHSRHLARTRSREKRRADRHRGIAGQGISREP